MNAPKRTVLISALAAALLSPMTLEASPPAAPEARLIKIENFGGREDRWISSQTELEAVFPIDLPEIAAVLEDFASYPSFVPHLKRTDVFPQGTSATRIGQHYEIAILGYRYASSYHLDITVDASEFPIRWTQRWKLVDSDGSIGASEGSWSLESVGTPEAPATRVIHRNKGLVRRVFPMQATFMRTVAARELGKSITLVYERSKQVSGNVLAAAGAQ